MLDKNFEKELQQLLNKHSIDNETSTPDFILADFLVGMIRRYRSTMELNIQWHSNWHRDPATPGKSVIPPFKGNSFPERRQYPDGRPENFDREINP